MDNLRRRTLVGGLFAMAGLGSLGWTNRNEVIRWLVTRGKTENLQLTENILNQGTVCAVSPEQTEGPFYVNSPLRGNIREDREGVPLELSLRLISKDSCQSLVGATVEIWHCDSAGRYSAYPENIARQPWQTLQLVGFDDPNGVHVAPFNDKAFLRGGQISDKNGAVAFSTIFPGWYDPRVPHVHIAITVEGVRRYTSQLYFPMRFANQIYATHDNYKPHGLCPYRHHNDPVLAEFNDARNLLVTPRWQGNSLKVEALLVLT